MEKKVTSGISEKIIKCPVCDADNAVMEDVREKFPYFDGKDEVELVAVVPTYSCPDCGNSVVGKEGQQARDSAVYRHHQRIPPWEISAIRKDYGMTQKQFAKAFGFGRASVERWENGVLIQNESMDNLMLLLRDPDCGKQLLAERIKEKEAMDSDSSKNVINLDRFRCLRQINEFTKRRAHSFKPGIARG